MAGKRRKRGDWESVAKAHAAVPRIMAKSHGLTNIPPVTEVGSAAYRRLQAKRGAE